MRPEQDRTLLLVLCSDYFLSFVSDVKTLTSLTCVLRRLGAVGTTRPFARRYLEIVAFDQAERQAESARLLALESGRPVSVKCSSSRLI